MSRNFWIASSLFLLSCDSGPVETSTPDRSSPVVEKKKAAAQHVPFEEPAQEAAFQQAQKLEELNAQADRAQRDIDVIKRKLKKQKRESKGVFEERR